MKFYSDIPSLMVWDPEKDKPIRFENGVHETKDPRIAAILKKAGLDHNENDVVPEPTEPDPEPVNTEPDYEVMTKNQIVGMLHKKGIDHNKRQTKEELIDLLRGGV